MLYPLFLLIRVSATPDRKFADTPSLVIVPQDSVPHFDVTDTDSTVSVSTSSITATVSLADGEVLFYDKDGKLILAEDEGGRRFTPIEVEGKKAYTVQQFFKSFAEHLKPYKTCAVGIHVFDIDRDSGISLIVGRR